MHKRRFAVVILLSIVAPFIAWAVPIGYFPGLDKLIDTADAIVVLRIDRHLSDFNGPTFYSTHECYIYQTIKGDIPENASIHLQLMNTEGSFATPYAHGSTHLMFLTKRATDDEPTEYRTLTFKGAQTLLSPLGHEKAPEGKTIKDKVTKLIKDAIAYQAQEHEKRQELLESLLLEEEAAEPSTEHVGEDNSPVETAKDPETDTLGGSAEGESANPTVDTMRSLAERIAKGDQAAFDELRQTARELYRHIDYDAEKQRVLSNWALMRAAFNELGRLAGNGNQKAFEALRRALDSADLSSFVPDALGIAAAAGHAESLDMLLHHNRHGILLSSAVFALQASAKENNDKAVNFLSGVLEDEARRPLWRAAAQGLTASAARGNPKAIAALKAYERITGTPVPVPSPEKVAPLEMQTADDGQPGEQIGQVLGRPVFRDEIRTGGNVRLRSELHRLFTAPVMKKYREAHKDEIEPTEDEILAATSFFDEDRRQRVKEEEPQLRERLATVQEQLSRADLTAEEQRKFRIEKRGLQAKLKLPGRPFAIFVLHNWKFQKHLYDQYGGGRILWQQAGLEAFDACRTWLESREKQGDFTITDAALRSTFYEYWMTMKHGAFLTDDKERIRTEFLEPAWLREGPSQE